MEPIINAMAIDESIDLKQIPLIALRQKGRLLLSKLLNPIKILPSEEGYPRDWRGIAYLAGIENLNGTVIGNQPDAMAKVLQLWLTENKLTATFDNLRTFLGIIDRWDVSDDISELLYEDAKFYQKQQISSQNQSPPDVSIEKSIIDENIITKDDVIRSQEGLSPQFYDAFVLFADEDIDFATELIEKMENYGFKLCARERDLIGGISFEHEAILRLISERCNRLIVIVSPAFLKSRANAFFVNFAQALGIEQGRRKIVPCLYERCVLPPTLNFYFLLNYQRSGKLWNFWEKLKDSIQSTPTELNSKHIIPRECNNSSQVPRIQITEIVSNTNAAIQSNTVTELSVPIKPPRKRNDISLLNDRINQKNLYNNGASTAHKIPTSTISKFPNQLPSSEFTLRAQSLTNLNNIKQQEMNCDITRSNTDVSKLKSKQNHKGTKWYKKFLSVSTIFDNSSTKKPKKHLTKTKLAIINS